MLNRIFGNFLVQNALITEEEVNSLLASKKGHKAKPETLCVLTKVLTCKQVEEVLAQCKEKNVDFKEHVVEAGVLTDDRLESVLSYEKNSFAIFSDLIIDSGHIDLEGLMTNLSKLQQEKKWTDTQLKAMMHWDVSQLVDMFVPLRNPQLKALTVALVNNLKRLVDADVYLDKAYVSNHYEVRHYASQEMLGDFQYNLYIEGEGDNLLGISNFFSGLKFEHVDEDVLDNVGEFINYINGQFASDMSYEDIDIDMASPVYSMDGKKLQNARIYIIPVHANGYEFRAIYEIHD